MSESDIIDFNQLSSSNASTQNGNLPNQLDYSGVEEVYEELKAEFDGELDEQKLQDGLREGLVRAAGDPFTEFLDVEASQVFEEELSGSFEGIGAELSKDEELIVVVSPIAGFPAEMAGIKAGDAIVEIDGESSIDISVTEAVKRIRGEKGTTVNLGIIRDGQRLDFEITREKISIASVESEIVAENIGVIRISRFGEDTSRLVNEAAQKFKNENVTGIILDLRGNPGGLLDSSVDVSSVWLKDGQIVLEERRGDEVIRTFTAEGNPILNGTDTVVLIDEGSASASEIVAGALNDNGAATLIGQKSYGKGSVQEVNRLNYGGILKVTVARWFTPDGVNIDKDGIEPDQVVIISDKEIEQDKDPQLQAAIDSLQ